MRTPGPVDVSGADGLVPGIEFSGLGIEWAAGLITLINGRTAGHEGSSGTDQRARLWFGVLPRARVASRATAPHPWGKRDGGGELLMPGRRESPLDPSTGPVARFAAELRKLRADAGGPTYRVMAQRTGQGASTLSQAAGGERLPTLPVVLAFVQACGGDQTQWEARWREASLEAAAEPRTEDEDAAPPYRGLARFEPGDAELFFGRGELTDRLLALTRSRRFSAVFGPSGSGKSSLLRAGLIPRLRALGPTGPRPIALRILTPGEHPVRAHEQRLIPKDAEGDTWLIVDQFEELYTLCTNPVERDQFIECLLAATDPASRLRVVIAVRADFLGSCAEHPGLTAALQEATVLAGPMSRDELREAIVKPAQAAGLIVERTLTARIVDEVEGEPGALPLMSHALLETWHRRKGRSLTEASYEAAGGLNGAIARTAEDLYACLTPAQAHLARLLLLRLITPGDGTADTRRPTPPTELDLADPGDFSIVLERLAAARLITVDDTTVDLAHEALITAWPRLHTWIEEDRERLRMHRRLTEAARAWEALDHDPGALYRGTRLATAEETFSERDGLTALESAFLTASIQVRDGEQRAATRTTRRLRSLVAGLTALVVVACAAAVVAFQQRATARDQRAVAVSRQIAAEADQLRGTSLPTQAQNTALAAQFDIASYRMHQSLRTYTSLVNAANAPLFSEVPDQSDHTGIQGGALVADSRRRLLAIPGDDSMVRLWDTRDFTNPRRVGPSLAGTVAGLSSDGGLLAVEDDDARKIRLWDTSDPQHPTQVSSFPAPGDSTFLAMALSPDGRLLSVLGEKLQLWDLHDRRHPARLPRSIPGDLAAFSPHGHVMATADSERGTITLWDTAHPTHLEKLGVLRDFVGVVTFSPDGQTLATRDPDHADQIRLWDTRNPKRPTLLDQPLTTADGSDAAAVTFSPGSRIAAVMGANGVQLWDVRDRQEPMRLGEQLAQPRDENSDVIFGPNQHSLITHGRVIRSWSLPETLRIGCSEIYGEGFSPNGQTLATVCHTRPVQLWNTADLGAPRPLGTLPSSPGALALHGHVLAAADPAGGTQLWDITDPSHPRRLGHTPAAARNRSADFLAFSGDGRMLAEYEDDLTNNHVRALLRLWDLRDPTRPSLLGLGDSPEQPPAAMALSPDGHMLSTTDFEGTIRFWNTRNPSHPTLMAHPLTGDTMAFAPHAHMLATVSDSGALRLWDTTRAGRPRPLGSPVNTDGSPSTVAFGPDGRILAIGTRDGMVTLWDVTDPARPSAIGDPLAGPTSPILAAVFGPHSRTLATVSYEGTARLWDLDVDRIMHRVCAATGHALNRTQWRQHLGNLPYSAPCP